MKPQVRPDARFSSASWTEGAAVLTESRIAAPVFPRSIAAKKHSEKNNIANNSAIGYFNGPAWSAAGFDGRNMR